MNGLNKEKKGGLFILVGHEESQAVTIELRKLGHNSSKTTEIYTHVSNNLLQTLKLPI